MMSEDIGIKEFDLFRLLEKLGFTISPTLKDDMEPVLTLAVDPITQEVLELNYTENS